MKRWESVHQEYLINSGYYNVIDINSKKMGGSEVPRYVAEEAYKKLEKELQKLRAANVLETVMCKCNRCQKLVNTSQCVMCFRDEINVQVPQQLLQEMQGEIEALTAEKAKAMAAAERFEKELEKFKHEYIGKNVRNVIQCKCARDVFKLHYTEKCHVCYQDTIDELKTQIDEQKREFEEYAGGCCSKCDGECEMGQTYCYDCQLHEKTHDLEHSKVQQKELGDKLDQSLKRSAVFELELDVLRKEINRRNEELGKYQTSTHVYSHCECGMYFHTIYGKCTKCYINEASALEKKVDIMAAENLSLLDRNAKLDEELKYTQSALPTSDLTNVLNGKPVYPADHYKVSGQSLRGAAMCVAHERERADKAEIALKQIPEQVVKKGLAALGDKLLENEYIIANETIAINNAINRRNEAGALIRSMNEIHRMARGDNYTVAAKNCPPELIAALKEDDLYDFFTQPGQEGCEYIRVKKAQ